MKCPFELPVIYDERDGCVGVYEPPQRKCLATRANSFIFFRQASESVCDDAGTFLHWEMDAKYLAMAQYIVLALNAHEGLVEACKVALEAMDKPAVQASGEWQTGMFCGLEDRGITDRYEACMYGYEQALEKVQEWVLCDIEPALAAGEKE